MEWTLKIVMLMYFMQFLAVSPYALYTRVYRGGGGGGGGSGLGTGVAWERG